MKLPYLTKKQSVYAVVIVGILVVYLAVKPASRDVTIYTTES